MIKTSIMAAALVLVAMLAGCGGGSTAGAAGTVRAAQGIYAGTTTVGSSTLSFQIFILPDNSFYAAYWGGISGVYTGQGTDDNAGTYSAKVTDYWSGAGKASATVLATYSENANGPSISAAITEGGSTITFNGNSVASAPFNYYSTPKFSDIVGSWHGSYVDGNAATISFSSDGSFAGTTSQGCNVSGIATPDNSKNVFYLSLTYGPSPCPYANQMASGMAMSYIAPGAQSRQMVAAFYNSNFGELWNATPSQ